MSAPPAYAKFKRDYCEICGWFPPTLKTLAERGLIEEDARYPRGSEPRE